MAEFSAGAVPVRVPYPVHPNGQSSKDLYERDDYGDLSEVITELDGRDIG